MTRGKAHSPEVRARAQSLLVEGKSQTEVCALTGLPKATVSGLAATIPEQLEHVRTEKKEAIGELIMGYFDAALRAMIAQAEVFGDPEYCRKFEPDKLAISHGVIGDKLAGIATTAQALGLIGNPPNHYDALPGATRTVASVEGVDTAPVAD